MRRCMSMALSASSAKGDVKLLLLLLLQRC